MIRWMFKFSVQEIIEWKPSGRLVPLSINYAFELFSDVIQDYVYDSRKHQIIISKRSMSSKTAETTFFGGAVNIRMLRYHPQRSGTAPDAISFRYFYTVKELGHFGPSAGLSAPYFVRSVSAMMVPLPPIFWKYFGPSVLRAYQNKLPLTNKGTNWLFTFSYVHPSAYMFSQSTRSCDVHFENLPTTSSALQIKTFPVSSLSSIQ